MSLYDRIIVRACGALGWLTYWVITAAERTQIAASDYRTAIVAPAWDAEHNPWLLPDASPFPRLSLLPWRKRR